MPKTTNNNSDSAYKKKAKRQRKSNGKSVSLSDVAKHANVSTATVSRVLNNPEKVAEKKRLLIQAAIDELGYIPDGAARALASRHTRTIGAIVPTLDNAIFAAGIQALQGRLKKLGYTLIVASHEYNIAEELHEVRTLLRQGIEGVMLVGSTHNPQLNQLLDSQQIPYVNCWSYHSDSPYPYIGFDNKLAAKKVAEYLLDLGHREFAVIAGHTKNNDRATDRLQGTLEALESQGVELNSEQILERSYSVKQGREAMRILLQTDAPPTAVICGNDVLALGALAECQASGINVPDEISITGFDDLDICSQLIPSLTTMRVPSAEMGKRAADFLIARINGETTLLHTEIDVDLMIRDTTAKPRTAVRMNN
ncbi:MAG: LacI family DNA-binding transcriptional regulator [Sedimenticola sp.]